MRIRDTAASRPRFGARRVWVMLRRDGLKAGKHLVRKLYKEQGLNMRWRRFKKRKSHLRIVPAPASRPNQRWALDFVSDKLACRRPFRVLTVIDLKTRKSLATVPSFTFRGAKVTDELDKIIQSLGSAPEYITLDNGPEFTSLHFFWGGV
jgi:putative transposase